MSAREMAKSPPTSGFQLSTDQWTKPYWDAAADHRLVAPRCTSCNAFRMPPTPFCPGCLSQAIEWVTLPPTGRLYAFTVVRRAGLPDMEAHIPFVPAIIELPAAGGVRIVSNIVDMPIDAIRIGMDLVLKWVVLADGTTVPRFAYF